MSRGFGSRWFEEFYGDPTFGGLRYGNFGA
jgi:hypothetical protein